MPAPEPGARLVVAVALLRPAGGAAEVLAAQRSYPPELAGRWELPGGKVEPGESEPVAVVRECAEELGVVVTPGRRLGAPVPAALAGFELALWTGRIESGIPQAREHQALRWCDADAVAELDWLDGEEPLLARLTGLLAAPPRL